MKNIPITVVIPVKNEECNLPNCLKLLKDFDQVVVIDSNSTDQTAKIAERFGVEIYQFFWDGKFPKKRNWALRNLPIRNEWVLFLDADEFITHDFKQEVALKIQDISISGYWITYSNHFMGRQLKYGEKLNKLALFKVGKGEYEKVNEDSWSHLDMEVHEHTILEGQSGKILTPILHNDFKSLESYIKKHNAYSSWEAHRFISLKKQDFKNLDSRQVLKYRLMEFGLLPAFYFIGSYIIKLGFLDGIEGFYYAQYKIQYFFQMQSKIKELKRQRIENAGLSQQSMLNHPEAIMKRSQENL